MVVRVLPNLHHVNLTRNMAGGYLTPRRVVRGISENLMAEKHPLKMASRILDLIHFKLHGRTPTPLTIKAFRECTRSESCAGPYGSVRMAIRTNTVPVQGYLAHQKHSPVGPYSSPMPRDL